MIFVRLVVADDHPVYRDGLVRALRDSAEITVVATATDGVAALESIRAERPDVAVVDIALPGMDGIAVLEAIQTEELGARAVVVTAYDDSATVYRAIAAGASAYVPKSASGREIREAVLAVARGETVLPPQAQAGLARELRMRRDADAGPTLSPRELDILRLAADGLSTSEIARDLHVSAATVKTHLQHAFAKLDVSDRAAAVAQVLRRGLLH
jgi:two-component system nitrate/nitrite response regulator NarL